MVERATAGQGLRWIRSGWQLLKLKPGVVIGTVLLTYILLFVASMIPMVGNAVAYLLAPFLAGGIYVVLTRVEAIAHRVDEEPLAREQPVGFDLLFSVFKRSEMRRPLIGLAAVGMLFNLAIMVLVAWFVSTQLAGTDHAVLTDPGATDLQKIELLKPMLLSSNAMLLWLVVLVLATLYAMATLFAVPLIVLRGLRLIEALRQSFRATLHNWLPFLVYGVVWMLLGISIAFSLGLSLILLVPLAYASIYASFRSIWPEADDTVSGPPETGPDDQAGTSGGGGGRVSSPM